MKLDVNQSVSDVFGSPITENEKPIPLGTLLVRALLGNFPDEMNLPAEEKVKRFSFAQAILSYMKKDDFLMPLSSNDIVLLKKLTGKFYTAALVKPIWDILEPS